MIRTALKNWICLTVLAASAAYGQAETNSAGASLPIVRLETATPIVRNQTVPGTLTLAVSPNAEEREATSWPGTVRLHGASSLVYPKKSFRFALDQPAQLLDMRERRRWVLNAAYIDRSLMRHKLAYDLFRSLSARGATRFAAASQFVELYLNGRYHGVYLLMERVDRQLLGLEAYHPEDPNPACLYKAANHAANFAAPGHAGYEQKEPDFAALPYWKPLDQFNQFVASATEAEFLHPASGIESRLDLDNAIDFLLLVLLTRNTDGITKNFYLARRRGAPGLPQPRFFFAPWDYDGTFGREWNAAAVPPAGWISNRLFDRLLGHSVYRKKLAARWQSLRQQAFSVQAIHRLIDDNVRALGAAAQRNADRWPARQGPYPDAVTFDDDIAQMKSWTEARLQWLDQRIHQISADH